MFFSKGFDGDNEGRVMERCLKAKEACQFLGISLSLLYNKLTAADAISLVRIGRMLRFDPDGLTFWQNKRKAGNKAELI